MTSFIVIGYLIAGIAQTMRSLTASHVSKPFWAINPTVGRVISNVFTWPIGVYATSRGPQPRGFLYATVEVLMLVLCAGGHVWVSSLVSGIFFSDGIFNLILTVIIAVLSAPIVMPLTAIILVLPIAMITGFLLDLIFPPKK